MRYRVRNAESKWLLRSAASALLLCVLVTLIAAHPAFAAVQESDGGKADPSGHVALTAGKAAAESLGAQGEDAPIAAGEIGTCVWTIDAAGKFVLAPADGDEGSVNFYNPVHPDTGISTSDDWRPLWYPHRDKIKSAQVEGVVHVDGQSCGLFEDCTNLVDVDLSGLDTSSVPSLGKLFINCTSLESADISMLDVSSVTETTYMFSGCTKLANVKLPDFSESAVTSLSEMFSYCESLVSVDLSTIDTEYVTAAEHMFYKCKSLRKVVVGDGWDLYSRSPDDPFFQVMFTDCESLAGARGTSYAKLAVDANADDNPADDVVYARIDSADMPGYFWSVESGGGNEQGEGGQSGQGGDEGSGNSGDEGGSGVIGPGNSENGDSDGAPSKPAAEASSATSGKPAATTTGAPATSAAKTKAKRTSIAKAKVKLSKSTFTYDGKAKKPGVTVKLGKKTLKKGRDYTVSYAKGRTKVGAYKVTVTGKGAYKSKVTKTFRIVAKPKRTSIAKVSVALSKDSFAYDGKAKKPGVTVKLGKKTLKKGRDYTVSYAKGRKNVGTYKVTLTGKGAYKSKAVKRFTVVPAAPKLKSVKAHKNSNGSSGFVASWKKSGKAAVGYQVKWSPAKSFKKAGAFTFDGDTQYAKSGAVALQVRTSAWLGKPVYVKMRAFQAAGGKTYYSAWSTAKRVKLKK